MVECLERITRIRARWSAWAIVLLCGLLLPGACAAVVPAEVSDTSSSDTSSDDPAVLQADPPQTGSLTIEGVSDEVQRRSLVRAGVILAITPEMVPQARNFRHLDASLKLRLALEDSFDPFNVSLTAINAAINTGTDSDNAFGDGWAGFSRRIGTYTTDDYSSEFFQTFFFPSIFRQDPRYHRIPYARFHVRLFHAMTHVLVSQSDDLHPCPNYGELLGTIASSTLTNVYHEGQKQGFTQTARRDVVSVGSDAAFDVLNEFLPDLVKHIKVRNIFLQRIAFEATR